MKEILFKYGPGTKVQDKFSGLQGVVTGCLLKKNGSLQCSVQPKSADGTTNPDSWYIDDVQLESDEPQEALITFQHDPGIKAEDKVTGLRGTIVLAIRWINGCTHYALQPKAKKGSNEKPDYFMVDEPDIIPLKIEDEHQLEDIPKNNPPGGPSTRVRYA